MFSDFQDGAFFIDETNHAKESLLFRVMYAVLEWEKTCYMFTYLAEG